jgi:hypothetical protein
MFLPNGVGIRKGLTPNLPTGKAAATRYIQGTLWLKSSLMAARETVIARSGPLMPSWLVPL